MRNLEKLLSHLEAVAGGMPLRSRTVIMRNDAPYIIKEIKGLIEQNQVYREKLSQISEISKSE